MKLETSEHRNTTAVTGRVREHIRVHARHLVVGQHILDGYVFRDCACNGSSSPPDLKGYLDGQITARISGSTLVLTSGDVDHHTADRVLYRIDGRVDRRESDTVERVVAVAAERLAEYMVRTAASGEAPSIPSQT